MKPWRIVESAALIFPSATLSIPQRVVVVKEAHRDHFACCVIDVVFRNELRR